MITLSFIWFHRSYTDPGAKPQGQKSGSFLPNWFSFCFSRICTYRTFLGASCSQGWPHIWVVPTDMCTKVMHNGKGTNPFKRNSTLPSRWPLGALYWRWKNFCRAPKLCMEQGATTSPSTTDWTVHEWQISFYNVSHCIGEVYSLQQLVLTDTVFLLNSPCRKLVLPS